MVKIAKPKKVDPWSLPREPEWSKLRDIRPCMVKHQCEGGSDLVMTSVAKWLAEDRRNHIVSVENLPARRIRVVVESSIYGGD